MTQPAWPSTMWQILGHDYDTQASYYGVKKASEPIHVQLDLSNYQVAIVNNTAAPLTGLSLSAQIFSLDNKPLLHKEEREDVPADSVANSFQLDVVPLLGSSGVVLVKLELRDPGGELVSENLYWLGAESSSYRALGRLPAADVSATASSTRAGDTIEVRVQLENRGKTAAIENKLTLLNVKDGSRILPAYLSDNYVSLLPGEKREIQIEYPASAAKGDAGLAIRGWNLVPRNISITPGVSSPAHGGS
jgi:hypothetical protein